MLPWKLRKRHILPASQSLLSVYFSLAKFQLESCNLFLAMIWQRTYTHELPKLCSVTLKQLTVTQKDLKAIQADEQQKIETDSIVPYGERKKKQQSKTISHEQ